MGDHNTREIPLTQGKVAIVDAEDFERLLIMGKWAFHNGYASKSMWNKGNQQRVYMHRVIMDAQIGQQIDHIDRDRLNNRKSNLRFCTAQENHHNLSVRLKKSTKYKGIHLYKRDMTWRAYITLNGITHHLGYYNTPEDAAQAYNLAATKYHGEFASLNVIPSDTLTNPIKREHYHPSGHPGVTWDKRCNKWVVMYSENKKRKYGGRYENIRDAIAAREAIIANALKQKDL